MGLLQALKMARSLPELLAAQPPYEVASPWGPYPSHLNAVVWPDIVGQEWLPLTRIEAMAVPAVARARRLICGSIAQLPLRAYRGDTLLDTQPIWIDRSDGDVPAFHRMLWTVDDLMFYGWSLWRVHRDAKGQVSHAVRVVWDRWEFDTVGRIVVDGALVDAHDYCLIPGLDEGLLYFAQRAIRHAAKLIRAADTAADTPTAQLELHQTNDAPMTREQVEQLVTDWAAARRGQNGGVAYTNQAIETKEHGSIDGQLLVEGRNAAAVDIARSTGIPASLLDASMPTASLTYQTAAGRNGELVDYGLSPYLAAISARLGMDDISPRGTRIEFDLERFTGPVQSAVAAQDDDGPAPNPGPDAADPAPASGPVPTKAGAQQ